MPQCYNRTRLAEGRFVQDGWLCDDVREGPRFVWLPDANSKLCRQIDKLPECHGCTAPKDVRYIREMTGQ